MLRADSSVVECDLAKVVTRVRAPVGAYIIFYEIKYNFFFGALTRQIQNRFHARSMKPGLSQNIRDVLACCVVLPPTEPRSAHSSFGVRTRGFDEQL